MALFNGLSHEQVDSIILGSELVTSGEASISRFIFSAAALTKNPKVRAGLALGAMAYTATEFAMQKHRMRKARKSYLIKIYQNDPMYDFIQKWLIDALPESEQRNVLASSIKPNKRYGSVDNFTPTGSVSVAYDGERVQTIEIDGHNVDIKIATVERTGPAKKASSSDRMDNKLSSLQIECKTIAARRAVLARLNEETAKMEIAAPRFRIAMRWGDFTSVSDIPVRAIESVVLKDGQAERVMDDLKTFLTQEDGYTRLGIPYRRGVLLSGPPGTGKTSLASAIAHELGLDVYYIALSAVTDDSNLSELLANVEPRSVLLLEDVDVVHAAKERDDEEKGISMAGLLNALDGFVTPHGLITIMTTNHIEVLDPALIRPGRIDLIETIGPVDQGQLERMCMQYIGHVPDGLPQVTEEHNIMPSEIIEVFKKTIASDDKNAIGRLLVRAMTDAVEHGIEISQSVLVHELMEETDSASL